MSPWGERGTGACVVSAAVGVALSLHCLHAVELSAFFPKPFRWAPSLSLAWLFICSPGWTGLLL